MTQFSYNGWLASKNPADFGGLAKLVVRGEAFAPGVRAGDVHTVLQYVAEQLDARVEPVDLGHTADDWGYNFRANTNNPTQLSCHASATAFDYNATRHPNGRKNTFTPAQFAEIARILAEVSNVVRQLVGYDEMHFEICANTAQVAVVAAKLRAQAGGTVVVPAAPSAGGVTYEPRNNAAPGARTVKLGSVGDDVAFIQRWHGLAADGEFGNRTDTAVRNTQSRNGLSADGVVGPKTWKLLGVGVAAPAPAPAAPASPGTTVKKGSKGDAVKILQSTLKKKYPAYSKEHGAMKVDGDFGSTTDAWVKELQGRSGLTADGVVGPKTWKALGL